MTATTVTLISIALGLAVFDWIAVATASRRAEYLLKPATMIPLIIAAATMDCTRPEQRNWFVVALVLSLLGDVFLMLPDEDTYFVPGLGSFLLGHLAYIGGLIVGDLNSVAFVVGVLIVASLIVAIAPKIVAGAVKHDRRLGVPILAYILVISVMVASAIGTGVAAAIAGAALFYLSDFNIGWSRFVNNYPASRIVIITTYHAAQILLVVSLAG